MLIPQKELLLFDIDGTLAYQYSPILMDGVYDWFDQYAQQYLIALCTNQGSVGLGYWMEQEGFGDPSRQKTQDQIWDRMDAMIANFPSNIQDDIGGNIFISFAYQAASNGQLKGQWSPVPPASFQTTSGFWTPEFRKPHPGMLLQAMKDARVLPENTMMIGNSLDDKEAAANAGVDYYDSDVFFGRSEAVDQANYIRF